MGDREFDDTIDKMLDEVEATGNYGYSTKPEDSIWIGENGELEPDDWIFEHLDRKHPLENILRAIIKAHPCTRADIAEQETRLDTALSALVCRRPSRGPKPRNWETLLKIAQEYWNAQCEGSESPELSPIIRKVAIELRNLNAEQIDNQTSMFRREFKANKDLLLRAVTGQVDQAQIERRDAEMKILALLAQLGVPSETSDQS